jgi:hypothetical protein
MGVTVKSKANIIGLIFIMLNGAIGVGIGKKSREREIDKILDLYNALFSMWADTLIHIE